jgi:hypothetical protein
LDDITAMTVSEQGRYYAATPYCLLTYDGERFLANSVPSGFLAERLLVLENEELWSLGASRVWRFAQGEFRSTVLPLSHVNSVWLSPKGSLWVSGSGFPNDAEIDWTRAKHHDAAVVRVSVRHSEEGK